MFSVVFLLVVATVANGQGPLPIRDYRIDPYYNESPKPYAFSYSAPLDDGVGQSSRSETADGSGRVQGSYTINNDEGHYRVVEYIADADGFRATIRTNEPGTDNQNPADVAVQSEAGPTPYGSGIGRPVFNAAVQPIATPYGSGIGRPVFNAAVQPIAPVINPAIVPEAVPVAPVPRPVYRRPGLYNARNYAYRPTNRYPY